MGDDRAGVAGPTVWRVYRDGPAPGARNMALDHALAERCGGGTAGDGAARGVRAGVANLAVLRLYEWDGPTVSFGRHEPARARWASARAASAPGAFVRRPTGGRAVLHRSELTYAVVLPERAFGGPRGAYVAVNEALVAGLRLLGVEVALATGGSALRPDAGPCFEAPAAGEVMAGGGKLVGSAQARLGRALLQHGAILLEDDQGALGAGSAARPLRSLIGAVPIDEVRGAVEEGFRRRFADAEWIPSRYDAAVLAAADHWESERYGRGDWTWKH